MKGKEFPFTGILKYRPPRPVGHNEVDGPIIVEVCSNRIGCFSEDR